MFRTARPCLIFACLLVAAACGAEDRDRDPGTPGTPGTGPVAPPPTTEAPAFEVAWHVRIGGPETERFAPGIVALDDGGVVIAGTISSTATFGSVSGAPLMRGVEPYGGFVARYDAAGDPVWVTTLGPRARPRQLVRLTNGTFVAAVSDLGGTLVALDSDGEILWRRDEQLNAEVVAASSDGGVFAAGKFRTAVRIDQGGPAEQTIAVEARGTDEVWLASLDADGAYRWARAMGGEEDDDARALVADAEGGVTLLGRCQETLWVQDGPDSRTLATCRRSQGLRVSYDADGFVRRNADGVALAEGSGGSDEVRDRFTAGLIAPDGTLYVGGTQLGNSNLRRLPGVEAGIHPPDWSERTFEPSQLLWVQGQVWSVFAGQLPGRITAFDAETGESLWAAEGLPDTPGQRLVRHSNGEVSLLVLDGVGGVRLFSNTDRAYVVSEEEADDLYLIRLRPR